MPWINTSLGPYTQSQNFSATVQYYEISYTPGVDDGFGNITGGGEEIWTYYPVTLVANETNPQTITIANDTISGHYGPVFNDIVTFMKPDETHITLTTMGSAPIGEGVWTKLASYNVEEVTSFIADPTRERTFTYTATAHGATTTVTSLVSDKSWTPGRDSLRSAVAATRG